MKKIKWDQKKWIDISPLLHEKSAVFPGDIPFQRKESMSVLNDEHLTLSSIQTTLHIGAHADAPIHYHAKGQTIEQRSLNFYTGKAQVVAIKGKPALITKSHLPKNFRPKAARILFRTTSFSADHWSDSFSAFDPTLIDYLANAGIKLIGIDTPSVDPATSKDLPAHQAIFRHNLAVLEGLDLNKAKPGLYQLIALPLKIGSGDASPVRAALYSL